MDIELDTTVVASTLSPLVTSFDHAGLESLIKFRADEKTQTRFEELAEKASNGVISPQEQREYDSIIRTSSIIAVLQAQAEKLLADDKDPLQ
ncbi:MAG: hypothetical protein NXI32_27370 [bacterium]|nr:hypothetical protein [bacterium]